MTALKCYWCQQHPDPRREKKFYSVHCGCDAASESISLQLEMTLEGAIEEWNESILVRWHAQWLATYPDLLETRYTSAWDVWRACSAALQDALIDRSNSPLHSLHFDLLDWHQQPMWSLPHPFDSADLTNEYYELLQTGIILL